MAGPDGVDINEVLQSIEKAKLISELYFDPYQTAPENIRLLVAASKDIHDVLSESEGLLRLWNQPISGQEIFNRVLEDIDTFIARYCIVDKEASVNSSPGIRKQTWKEMKTAIEQKRAKELHLSLMKDMHRFIQLFLVLALNQRNHPEIHDISTLHGKIKANDSRIDDIARRLSEIKYQVEHREKQGSQLSNDRLDNLERQLEREWRLLCLRAGFEDRAHRPAMPASLRDLLLSPDQVYHALVLKYHQESELDALTSHTMKTAPLLGAQQNQRPSTPPERLMLSQAISPIIEPNRHHIILGDPALPVCIAEFEMRPRQMLKLQSWKLSFENESRVITWTSTKPGNVLEHYMLSPDALPYTLHSSLKATSKGYSLTFHGAARIRWLKNDQQRLNEVRNDLQYNFVERTDLIRFQEELRDKDLLETFDVETIKSNWSRNRFEAVNQDLKLWCSRDDDRTLTLSFFANHLQEHVEFPLDWFDPIAVIANDKRSVQLNFFDQPKASSARGSSFLRKFSTQHKKERTNSFDVSQTWNAVGSSASSIRSSISTSTASTTSSNASTSRLQAMARLSDKFQYLLISFSAPQQSSSKRHAYPIEEDGFNRFSELITKILQQRDNFPHHDEISSIIPDIPE